MIHPTHDLPAPPNQPADLADALARLTPRLLRLTRRHLSDPDDAGDVVQEALAAALRALPAFAGRAALSTWLHRIAMNTILMELRRRRRRARWLQPTGTIDPANDVPDDNVPSMEDRASARERAHWLHRGLATLPRGHQDILTLRDLHDLDVDTTAERLGITRIAVRVRHHRARGALRQVLESFRTPHRGAVG
jgi:RNA polymerase sigma-70 factor, ECF subfamily